MGEACRSDRCVIKEALCVIKTIFMSRCLGFGWRQRVFPRFLLETRASHVFVTSDLSKPSYSSLPTPPLDIATKTSQSLVGRAEPSIKFRVGT